jgi:hypothetical protein
MLQGPRTAFTPAETLLPPVTLQAIAQLIEKGGDEPGDISGTDAKAGEIVVSCQLEDQCAASRRATAALRRLIRDKVIPAPSRAIRLITWESPTDVARIIEKDAALPARVLAAIDVYVGGGDILTIIRAPWSAATIADEVVEVFATQPPFAVRGSARTHAYGSEGHQFAWAEYGIPTVQLLGGEAGEGANHAAFVAAASAYFLASMPNDGSEALLTHLTVGAHARLAEDGRRAVAQMGNQQRASADVLIMFGQAIEREQRRMRSFERFVPSPVDPMLRSRIAEMQKGITSVWTSMGITSSPFVPAAERIRGRGGEDRRVPARTTAGTIGAVDTPTAFLKFDHPDLIVYELHNFIDGTRSISDIRDAVSAEFGALPLPSVVDYFERLAKTGAITLK